jgi:fatty-acyl-CoA synthase
MNGLADLEGEATMAGIGLWLTKRDKLSGDQEALVQGRRRLTYRELNQRVNRLASWLLSSGLRQGDRCAYLAYNGIEVVELIFAAAKAGLILVPLNWRLASKELSFILSDSGTETLLFDVEFAKTVDSFKTDHGIHLKREIVIGGAAGEAVRYEEALAGGTGQEPDTVEAISLDTPHIIMYTAGTTGLPKGAVLTQGCSFWNAVNLELDMAFSPKDRDLLVLPMFHIGGIGLFTLPMIHVGGTIVIERSFDAGETLRRLRDERITLFFGVPAIFLFLIQHPEFSAEFFKGVRLVMSGGAPLPVSLVRRYHKAGVILQQGFGMSEASPSICTLPKELALKKAGSIGRALLHVEARIVDEAMKDVAPNEIGELVIRGPNVMNQYWNRPEATVEAFAGGWFHSGDMARMDEDGDLTIVDRKKDMFISGGENVYPAEVENAIFELSQVAEAAVIGIKDERWGEVGRAVIASKPGKTLTELEVLDSLKGRLAKYKIPKSVVFVDQLPRNAAGKVLKNVLRERYR